MLRELREKIIKDFLDVLILKSLDEFGSHISGYDVISFVHKRFGILVSSGTVYSVIYAMERKGLILGMREGRKRVYKLTKTGKETIEAIMQRKSELIRLIRALLIEA